MFVKYKKYISFLVLAVLLLGLMGFSTPALSGKVSADTTCAADNTDLCKTTQCKNDTQGNAIDCTTSVPTSANCNATSCDLVSKYVQRALNLLSVLVGVVAAISIIYGGIQYTTSGGDPQKVSAAKKRITLTIVSLIAYAFLFGFLQFLVPGGLFNRS